MLTALPPGLRPCRSAPTGAGAGIAATSANVTVTTGVLPAAYDGVQVLACRGDNDCNAPTTCPKASMAACQVTGLVEGSAHSITAVLLKGTVVVSARSEAQTIIPLHP